MCLLWSGCALRGAWGAQGKMGQAEAAASVFILWSGYCLTRRFKAPLTTLLASLIGSAGVNRLSGDRRQPICRSVASLANWCAAVGRLSDDDPRMRRSWLEMWPNLLKLLSRFMNDFKRWTQWSRKTSGIQRRSAGRSQSCFKLHTVHWSKVLNNSVYVTIFAFECVYVTSSR